MLPPRALTNETAWIGATLAFGSAKGPRLRLDRRIDRCVIPTIDPDSGRREPAIMRVLVDDFSNENGAYGATEAPGTIAVGDSVWLGAEAGQPPLKRGARFSAKAARPSRKSSLRT